MEVLILTDIHSANPFPLIERKFSAGIEKVVTMLDVDDPRILRKLLEIPQNKAIAIGNHEHAHCVNAFISSEYFKKEGYEYSILWNNTPEKKLVLGLYQNPPVINEKLGIIIEHQFKIHNQSNNSLENKTAAFSHSTINDDCHKCLNERLLLDYEGHYHLNHTNIKNCFEEMRKKNYSILFRGHDHTTHLAEQNNNGQILTNIVSNNSKITLNPNKKYIITVGPFIEKEYCIFDDEKLTVSFNEECFVLDYAE